MKIRSTDLSGEWCYLHNYICRGFSLRCEDHIISLFPYLRCEDLILILKPSQTPSSHPSSHAFLFLIFSSLKTKIFLNIFPLSLYIHLKIFTFPSHICPRPCFEEFCTKGEFEVLKRNSYASCLHVVRSA